MADGAHPRWIDGDMEQPWFRDLIAGSTAEHAADLTGWAERIAHTYSRGGTLEVTAVVWALLDRIDALQADREAYAAQKAAEELRDAAEACDRIGVPAQAAVFRARAAALTPATEEKL